MTTATKVSTLAPRARRRMKPPEPPDVVTQYALDVVAGRLVAGKLVRLACERHLRDLANGARRGLVWDPAAAMKAIGFFPLLRHYKGQWGPRPGKLEGDPIRLEAWQQFIVGCAFGWKRADGLRRFRNLYIEVAKKNGKTLMAAGIGLLLAFFDDEPGAEVYCLDPSTRVLTADLRWVPVGSLRIGDTVQAFDEEPPTPRSFRKLRRATVTSSTIIRQPRYRITLEDGRTIVASGAHMWLGKRARVGDRKAWVRTDQLYAGSRIRDLGAPWVEGQDWGAGYLSGIFDGEGNLHGHGPRSGFRVAFAQRPGAVLDKTRALLEERAIRISPIRHHASGVDTFEVQGMYASLRLLGEVRPERLLNRVASNGWLEGKAANRVNGYATVRSVQALGVGPVVAIGTTTRTLFAEGLFSHNSAATKRDQAKLVWKDAAQMVKKNLGLRTRIQVLAHSLTRSSQAQLFQPLGKDSDSDQGINPHGAIIDELHVLDDREVIDNIETAASARAQPMIVKITTAGVKRESVWADERADAVSILEGRATDDSTFAIIYTLDEGDDPFDEQVWPKSNPNLSVSVMVDTLRDQAAKAQRSPAALGAYLRFRQNIPTAVSTRAIDIDEWDACAGNPDGLPYDEWVEQTIPRGTGGYEGLDLASVRDLTALVLLARLPLAEGESEDDAKYAVLCRFWCPEAGILDRSRRDGVPYDDWVRDGYLTATEGNITDYAAVRSEQMAIAERYVIGDIGFDRWNATQLVTDLQADGATCTAIPQTHAGLGPAWRELEKLILEHRLVHGGHPVLRWMAGNVEVETDSNGNQKPSKRHSSERIDGIVALTMALNRWLAYGEAPGIWTAA